MKGLESESEVESEVAQSCPTLCDPVDCKNTGVGYHFLLQGISPTQGLNLCLLHWQADSLPLSYPGSQVQDTFCIK